MDKTMHDVLTDQVMQEVMVMDINLQANPTHALKVIIRRAIEVGFNAAPQPPF